MPNTIVTRGQTKARDVARAADEHQREAKAKASPKVVEVGLTLSHLMAPPTKVIPTNSLKVMASINAKCSKLGNVPRTRVPWGTHMSKQKPKRSGKGWPSYVSKGRLVRTDQLLQARIVEIQAMAMPRDAGHAMDGSMRACAHMDLVAPIGMTQTRRVLGVPRPRLRAKLRQRPRRRPVQGPAVQVLDS